MKFIIKVFKLLSIVALLLSFLFPRPLLATGDDFFLAIPPLKGETSHQSLLIGFQQLLIDDWERITGKKVLEREKIDQYLKSKKGHEAGLYIYTKDVMNFSRDMKVKFVVLCRLKEEEGRAEIDIRV